MSNVSGMLTVDNSQTRLLVEAGARIEVADTEGWTPLAHLIHDRGSSPSYNEDVDYFTSYYKRSRRLPRFWSSGNFPTCLESVRYLVEVGGADPNSMLPFHPSSNSSDDPMIECTALHAALEDPKPEIVDLLVSNGADPDLEDETGWTILRSLVQKKLEDFKPRESPVVDSLGHNTWSDGDAERETFQPIHMLLDIGANVQPAVDKLYKMDTLEYPAYLALVERFIRDCKCLERTNEISKTPLEAVMWEYVQEPTHGRKAVARLLMQYGADTSVLSAEHQLVCKNIS